MTVFEYPSETYMTDQWNAAKSHPLAAWIGDYDELWVWIFWKRIQLNYFKWMSLYWTRDLCCWQVSSGTFFLYLIDGGPDGTAGCVLREQAVQHTDRPLLGRCRGRNAGQTHSPVDERSCRVSHNPFSLSYVYGQRFMEAASTLMDKIILKSFK